MNRESAESSKHISNIEESGFSLLKGVFSMDQCENFIRTLEAVYSNCRNNYSNSELHDTNLSDKSGEKVVYNLHNKDAALFPLLNNDEILSTVRPLLIEGSYRNAEEPLLLNSSARCPLKDGGHQQLHIDSKIPGAGWTLFMNVLIYLNKSSIENGATRIVPASHIRREFAVDGAQYEDEIVLEAEPGDCLIFDASTWHGGTANLTGDPRWAAVLGYGRWFMKPAFDFVRNTPPDMFEKMDDGLKELLGFRCAPPVSEFQRVRRKSVDFENLYQSDSTAGFSGQN